MADVTEHPLATKVKETNAPARNAPARTEWRTPDTAQWNKADETVGSDIWSALSTPVSKRRSVARDFASAMSARSEVAEVWLTDVENDLAVAISLSAADFEIEARTLFIDLVCQHLEASEGDLFVFPSGQVPDWVKRGRKLA